MKQEKVVFRHQQIENVHKIYLYDEIRKYGDFNWETWDYDDSETSAKHFQEILSEIPETDKIEIYFNSNGGSVDQGTAIYNMLQEHGAYKTGIVMGCCHSIAFTILQACDKRVMGYGTTAIIHDMWETFTGNASDFRAEADNLDVAMDSCVALFMKRATIPEEELRDMMHKETTLSPQLALQYGLIDEIGVEFKSDQTDADALQEVLKENEKLRQQIVNRTMHQEQLTKFYQLTHGSSKPEQSVVPEQKKKPEQESTDWGVFFNLNKTTEV